MQLNVYTALCYVIACVGGCVRACTMLCAHVHMCTVFIVKPISCVVVVVVIVVKVVVVIYVYVCMCVYIYIYIYTYTHTHIDSIVVVVLSMSWLAFRRHCRDRGVLARKRLADDGRGARSQAEVSDHAHAVSCLWMDLRDASHRDLSFTHKGMSENGITAVLFLMS